MRINHITVCVGTYRRPELLRRLLLALDRQETRGFTYSVVVADNDAGRSAETLVKGFAGKTPVVYCAEPEQNIALARNRALSYADGEFAALIDDDQVPGDNWLANLHGAYNSYAAEGVLGPVRPYFDGAPPVWVTKGRFFERPSHPTGTRLHWRQCRAANLLLATRILQGEPAPFERQSVGRGDADFFRRMTDNGHVFTWCQEAPVMELVPQARCTPGFLLKRAMLRGSSFPLQPGSKARIILKSLVAVPVYAVALPVLALVGGHLFLKYFVKLSEHGSRLLASAGWSLVKERET